MELNQIKSLLEKVRGCTFASLDTKNHPSVGVCKITRGESVLIFNSRVSGYENMVRRRLEALGKTPDNFVLNDLPWGERVEGEPNCLIFNKGVAYLQTIAIKSGEVEVYVGDKKVPPDEVKFLLPNKSKGNSQGLPDDRAVIVRTHKLESITSIRLMGEEVRSDLGSHEQEFTRSTVQPQPREKRPTLRVPGLSRD